MSDEGPWQKVLERMAEVGRTRRQRLVGLRAEEIDALERACGHRFPESYRGFLLTAGRDAGPFLVGSEYAVRHFSEMREGLVEALEESDAHFELSDTAHVFFMHQGYDFCFFKVGEGPDPPVWELIEGHMDEPERVWDSFTSWLQEMSRFI